MRQFIVAGLFLLLAIAVPAQKIDSTGTGFSLFESKLNQALKGLKMTRHDLSLRDDYLDKDKYRLRIIDSLMQAPLGMLDLAGQLTTIDALYAIKLISGDIKSRASRHAFIRLEYLQPEMVVGKYFLPSKADIFSVKRMAYFLSRLDSLITLKLYDAEYEPLLDSAIYGFSLLLEEDIEDEFRIVDELDSIQKYEEGWAEILAEIAGRIDLNSINKMMMIYLDLFEDSVLNESSLSHPQKQFIEIETSHGKICIGDSTTQHYKGDIFMVIDYGGNDFYDIAKNGKANCTFIIDYGGSDIYHLPQNKISPYALGANIIIDFEGDDYYHAGSWNLGAGLFGVGILWDKQGNDHYIGDTFTMGAGCFGLGILFDQEGNDNYQAALFAQGFGFVRGTGILMDVSGNDHYFAGGKYKDILRYEDHYLSLSQGFGYGLRPYMSGGTGYLIDQSGNDTYESDIFGQGCSYWWSLGLLADAGGNDKYLSFQYAQGSATHMTLGCLYDKGGDDLYVAKGVSQGCGHDRAVGILYDEAGVDNYMAYDLSQGAGSANGIGILTDLDGSDSYLVKKDSNTQGYGNPRRDYGSIGIFIDAGGRKDSYAGGNGADSSWWGGSMWGIGLDE
jgi:hypothetical protein